MGDDVEKMFRPTWLGWAGLLPHKLRNGTKPEDKDFLDKFNQMVVIRDHLKQIEAAVSKWNVGMKKLVKSAKELGEAVETNKKLFDEANWAVDMYLKDNSALDNIKEKIGMINDLIGEKKRLKYMRLKGDYAEYKLEQLRKKEATEAFEKLSEKYLNIKKEAERQRAEIIQQILLVVDKYVSQANEHGVSDLVKPQLQAFKLNQFHLFLNCQKLVQGNKLDEGLEELVEHWSDFTKRIANTIPNNAAGGSFDGSAILVRDKIAVDKKVSDFTELDAEFDKAMAAQGEIRASDSVSQKKNVAAKKPPPMDEDKDRKFRDSDFDGEDLSDVDTKLEIQTNIDDDDDTLVQ